MVLENGTNTGIIQSSSTSTPTTMVKCVDVSSYQGDINWSLVKSAGINHAILKIIRKDLNPDTKFEQNWKNCQSANITVAGVYNYSYATTTAKAKSDAQKVLSILNGRKATVWLDVEDTCQQGIGTLLKDIINTYRDVIADAGYDFGVYTGMSFYNSYIKSYISQIKCDNWWIARYYDGYTQMTISTNPDEQYNPKTSTGRSTIYGWQYTSSGQINGISGNVDLSVIDNGVKASVSFLGKINTQSGNLNIRSAPNSTSARVGTYKKDELVYLISKTSTNWYKTDKGYISGDYAVAARGKIANCTKLNMRNEPKVETNNVVSVLNVNDEVYLLEETGGWYKVQTKDNLVGYVSGKYIKIL